MAKDSSAVAVVDEQKTKVKNNITNRHETSKSSTDQLPANSPSKAGGNPAKSPPDKVQNGGVESKENGVSTPDHKSSRCQNSQQNGVAGEAHQSQNGSTNAKTENGNGSQNGGGGVKRRLSSSSSSPASKSTAKSLSTGSKGSSTANGQIQMKSYNDEDIDKLLRNPKPSTSTSLDSYSSNSNSSSDLAEKMARKATLKTSYSVMPAEPKRFKFEPNEDYLDQLIAMGISVNGGKKALFYTGNKSVSLATNWIFDHPEIDLETPLEEEMKRLAAEEEEQAVFDEEEEEDEEDSDGYHMDDEAREVMAQMYMHHHHKHHAHHSHLRHGHHHHGIHGHVCNGHGVDEETDSEESDEPSEDYDDDIPDFKMVFVVNLSLNMASGKIAAQVGHAALGLQRVLAAQTNRQNNLKVTHAELGVWQDFGEKMVVLKGESTQHLRDLELMAEDLDLPCFLVKDAGITQVPSGAVTVFCVFGEEEDVNKITGRLKLL